MTTEAHRSERSLPRKVLDRIDAELHQFRRKRAIRRLRELPSEPRVLFVCHGNVCRSPYAEYAFARLTRCDGEARARLESGGFIGAGRGSPEEAREVAAERGLDLDDHVSAPLDLDRVRRSDLIVVMEPRQRRSLRDLHGRIGGYVLVLGDLDPRPILWRRIRDPWGHDRQYFVEVFDRIDRCLGTLAAALQVRVPGGSAVGGERGGMR